MAKFYGFSPRSPGSKLANKKKQTNQQNKCKGLSFFIQRCECYSRCDWSLPLIYWSANTCMDDVTGKLFYLLCSTWRAVLNMLVRLFRIKQVKASKKSLAGAIYKEEKWKNGDKKSSWRRMPKLQEIFTTVAIVSSFLLCFTLYLRSVSKYKHPGALIFGGAI